MISYYGDTKEKEVPIMETMSRTAKILDRIIQAVQWLITLAAVVGILACLAIGFAALTNSPIFSRIDTTIDLGTVNLDLAVGAAPPVSRWTYLALAFFGVLALPVYCIILKTIRDSLQPFIHRQPFRETVARDLQRLSILVAANTALEWSASGIMAWSAQSINIEQLLLSDAVRSVTVEFGLDLTPLLFAGALYLLSKVFLYGQELQTLSDETL